MKPYFGGVERRILTVHNALRDLSDSSVGNLLWIDRKGSGSRFKYLRDAQLNLLNAEGVYIAPSHRHRYHFSQRNVKCNKIAYHHQSTVQAEYIITCKFEVPMMRKRKLWVMAFAT